MQIQERGKKRTHDEDSGVVTNCLGESSRTLLLDDVPPSNGTRGRSVENLGFVLGVDKSRDRDLLLETGLSSLSLDGRTVDDKVSEVGEELLSSVLTGDKVEQ